MSFFFISQYARRLTTVGTSAIEESSSIVATSTYRLLAWMYLPIVNGSLSHRECSRRPSTTFGAWRMYSMFFSDFSVYSERSYLSRPSLTRTFS